MKRIIPSLFSILIFSFFLSAENTSFRKSAGDLNFDSLAIRWDEAIPLGNGTIGSLIWCKDGKLRMSLDRTDLWDLRPMDSLVGKNYSFEWVKSQIRKGDYLPVQQKFDHPYNREAAPSKIPGAALEFSLKQLGKPSKVMLYLKDAVCEVIWPEGTRMISFVQADRPAGWFQFTNLRVDISPQIISPEYQAKGGARANDHSGASLKRLGYEQGLIKTTSGKSTYHQKGYEDFYYDVAVIWKRNGDSLTGVWSITSSLSDSIINAEALADNAFEGGIAKVLAGHKEYWDNFWEASDIRVPDPVIQRQYDNEMYKLGSVARHDSYPISLQAVWTADNGYLPPWKGDYHHDLNTQLSYWPVYTGNHLSEGLGYLNTLWNQRDIYRKYTREYFGKPGMNVPGVATLLGEPMGGWIQYSMSQTCGAWLAQHF